MGTGISTFETINTNPLIGNIPSLVLQQNASSVLGLQDSTIDSPFTFGDFRTNLPFLDYKDAIEQFGLLIKTSENGVITERSAKKFLYYLTNEKSLWKEIWWDVVKEDASMLAREFIPSLKSWFLENYKFARDTTHHMKNSPLRPLSEMTLTAGGMLYTMGKGLLESAITTYEVDKTAIKTKDPETNGHAFFFSSVFVAQFLFLGNGIKNFINKPPTFAYEPIGFPQNLAYSTSGAVSSSGILSPAIDSPAGIIRGGLTLMMSRESGDSFSSANTSQKNTKAQLDEMVARAKKEFGEENPFDIKFILSSSITPAEKVELIRAHYNQAKLHQILKARIRDAKKAPAYETAYTLPVESSTGLIQSSWQNSGKTVYIDFVINEFDGVVLDVLPSREGLIKVTSSDNLFAMNGPSQASEAINIIRGHSLTSLKNESFSIGSTYMSAIDNNIIFGRNIKYKGWDVTWDSSFAKGEHGQSALVASRYHEWVELRPVETYRDFIEFLLPSGIYDMGYEIFYNDFPMGRVSILRANNTFTPIGTNTPIIPFMPKVNEVVMHLHSFPNVTAQGYRMGAQDAFLAWAVKYANQSRSTLVLRDFPHLSSSGYLRTEILTAMKNLIDEGVITESQLQFFITDSPLENITLESLIEMARTLDINIREIRVTPNWI